MNPFTIGEPEVSASGFAAGVRAIRIVCCSILKMTHGREALSYSYVYDNKKSDGWGQVVERSL
jgi:hypothetical protein